MGDGKFCIEHARELRKTIIKLEEDAKHTNMKRNKIKYLVD
jgi:hypothetical protein